MIIDFHTHIFPDNIAAYALKHMQSMSHTAVYTDGTAQSVRRSMARAGVTYSVVLPVITNPLKTSHINDISIAHDPSDGLIYFGGIHPDTPNWQQELDKLAQGGIKGFKIHPLHQNTNIDDIRYLRILDRAAQLGLMVVMHAGGDPAFPGENRGAAPIAIRRALDQVGPVTLVAAHMGGVWSWDDAVTYLAGTGTYIDTSNALGKMVPAPDWVYDDDLMRLLPPEKFCQVVRAFGADHVLYGSDSPWTDQAESTQAIRDLPLSNEETDLIFYKNACKLLDL